MSNRQLTADELARAHEVLREIRARLDGLAGGDNELLFAYRRKVYKELIYDERSKPAHRNAVKLARWNLQGGKCAHCAKEMPLKYAHLDRIRAVDGYTVENTELIHGDCHHDRQALKRYT